MPFDSEGLHHHCYGHYNSGSLLGTLHSGLFCTSQSDAIPMSSLVPRTKKALKTYEHCQ